ncbi:MAG: ABC transporter substrate-binding protein, partial [Anaerolineae bacterium]|nr:ABC transporter substrate-binding protein [Anaerolineae bacterium]
MLKKVFSHLMVAALLVMALGASLVSAQDDPVVVKIGGIHPLTGGLANDGIGMDNAIQMAVDEINESGMLEGYVLEYVSAD